MWVTTISVAATIVGLARAWPQVARIVRKRNAEGVSAWTWMLSMCTFITWEAIGIVERITATMVFNALAAFGSIAVLCVIVLQGAIRAWWPVVIALVACVINVAIYRTLGAAGTVALGVALSMLMFIPQAVSVLRKPSAGVSTLTWWFSIANSLLWALYFLMIQEFALITPTLVMVPASAVILASLIRQRALVQTPT